MSADRPSSAPIALAFGSLGIVYGDIGTSPIYAFREAFDRSGLVADATAAFGVVSVVFWSLVIVIAVKYLGIVMRADNHGEGGILALTALMSPDRRRPRLTTTVVTLGVFGTALLFGDGLITPAISVLSAVEGFEVASDAFSGWAVPVAVVILIGLFAVQRRGTTAIARAFGPVMLVWFGVLALLGLRQMVAHPAVLRAVSPSYAIELFVTEPWAAFLALGSVFLVVTGGEALYADMGHFGRWPIALGWYTVVFPGLVLNYFGQAALIVSDPEAVHSPFYRLAPSWGVGALAVLATVATVIASQALISGAFSLAVQAVQLDYMPRLRILHTSAHHIGQVYVPVVNWMLMIGCVALVVGFRTSSNLASAYGIAVTTTMLITTLLLYRVARDLWGWSTRKTLAVTIPLLVVDLAFFSANVPKIPTGGWFPLLVGAVVVTLMTTWRRGRQLVGERIRRGERPSTEVLAEARRAGAVRVPGTAVYLSKSPGAPPALVANVAHNKAIHATTLLVTVATAEVPRVPPDDRLEVTTIGRGVHQVRIAFGFTEQPDVPGALARLDLPGWHFDPDVTTYFLGRESVTASERPGMHPWREDLFVFMNRSAASAARFFALPADRVFEVGTYVDI